MSALLGKNINLLEGMEDRKEVFEDGDGEEFDEVAVIEGDEGDIFTGILQKLLLVPREPDNTQKHEIFPANCTIKKKVCDVIVDGKIVRMYSLKH